jgi:MFS family permease
MSEQFKGPVPLGQGQPEPAGKPIGDVGGIPAPGSILAQPGTNEMILFWASFLTLIAAGMGFSIRGDILIAWGREFGFTQTDLGLITGQGLVGFGITIIFFSFFSDLVGYGKLMIIAFLLHFFSIVSTLAAPYAFEAGYGRAGAFWCLYVGAWSFSLANGTCEAVINPLTASLFPRNKTHWLNILHAGWPGGLVLGAVVAYVLNMVVPGVGWRVKWGIVLLPMLIYGVLMLGRRFPRSEASASGIALSTMIATLVAPLLLFLFLIHMMVGYVELGTDSWIINITETVLANKDAALLAFIWTNILMFTLRFFAGPIVHLISPLGLLFCSAALGTLGLVLLGMPMTNTVWLWLGAVTVYGIGKTFYWPTMLGVISERFPRGGALALGFSGGLGMISAGLLGGPCIGYKQDFAATSQLRATAMDTYERYRSEEPQAPLPGLPKIAGLDNGKVGVLTDYKGITAKEEAAEKEGRTLTAEERRLQLEKDIELLRQGNRDVKALETRQRWWESEGQPNATHDYPRVNSAQLEGGKTALMWTAFVPAAMAMCYLLLILYFQAIGGYQAEVLTGHRAEDEKFTGGTPGPGEG